MVAPFGILDLHLQQFDENLALICLGSFELPDIIVSPLPCGFILASGAPLQLN